MRCVSSSASVSFILEIFARKESTCSICFSKFSERKFWGTVVNSGGRKAETISGFHVSTAVSAVLLVRKVVIDGRMSQTSVVICNQNRIRFYVYVSKRNMKTNLHRRVCSLKIVPL